MKNPQHKRPLWAVDCETDPFDGLTIPKPFIWGVYDGYKDRYWEFMSTEEFIEFITAQQVLVYAHNGGKFDWHFLTPWLQEDDKLLFIAGRLARFIIGSCEFRDSMNLMPIRLEQYQKQKFDYDMLHNSVRHKYMPEIRTYLKSDCVNLWNLVYGFESSYGRHLTQASAAMKIWLKNYWDGEPPKTIASFYDEYKPYYYGGRVQCFQPGDHKVKATSIDINSAYPFAMLHGHPIGKARELHVGKPRKAVKNWGPMFFEIECTARGCFPYRDKKGALYFPADDVRRKYLVTGWEVRAAIETETIDPDWEVIRYTEFDDTTDFKGYVNYFWKKRQEFKAAGDKGGEYYCKIFLNALYGKFGADPRKYNNHEIMRREHFKAFMEVVPDKSAVDFYPFREWMIIRTPNEVEKQRFYNIATAASITGFVRAMLWRVICRAEEPFYCDTDSICAKGFPKDAVTIGEELGEWGIEGRYDRVVIAGKKMYAYHFVNGEWKTRSKGVKLDENAIIKIVAGETVTYNPQAPTFSARGTAPEFIPRKVIATGKDITRVPPEVDPQFVIPVTE